MKKYGAPQKKNKKEENIQKKNKKEENIQKKRVPLKKKKIQKKMIFNVYFHFFFLFYSM